MESRSHRHPDVATLSAHLKFTALDNTGRGRVPSCSCIQGWLGGMALLGCGEVEEERVGTLAAGAVRGNGRVAERIQEKVGTVSVEGVAM